MFDLIDEVLFSLRGPKKNLEYQEWQKRPKFEYCTLWDTKDSFADLVSPSFSFGTPGYDLPGKSHCSLIFL